MKKTKWLGHFTFPLFFYLSSSLPFFGSLQLNMKFEEKVNSTPKKFPSAAVVGRGAEKKLALFPQKQKKMSYSPKL